MQIYWKALKFYLPLNSNTLLDKIFAKAKLSISDSYLINNNSFFDILKFILIWRGFQKDETNDMS